MKTKDTDFFFPKSFHTYLQDQYLQQTAQSPVSAIEAEYSDAITQLNQQLSADRQPLLTQLEQQFVWLRSLLGEHSYLAGLYFGFEQLFSPDAPTDGFEYYLGKRVLSGKQMSTYKQIHAVTQTCNTLYEQLYNALPPQLQACIAAVGCAWEQRIYSAALDAFALGTLSTGQILDTVLPQ